MVPGVSVMLSASIARAGAVRSGDVAAADRGPVRLRVMDELRAGDTLTGFAGAAGPRLEPVPVVPTEGVALLIFTVIILWQLSLSYLRQYWRKPEVNQSTATIFLDA